MSKAKNILAAYNKGGTFALAPFVAAFGPAGGIFLCQALWWTTRDKVGDGGWFYQSQKQWTIRTGLTRRNQETARRSLKKHEILFEKRVGSNGRLNFRVDLDALEAFLTQCGMAEPAIPSSESTYDDSVASEWRNPPNRNGGFVHTKKEEEEEDSIDPSSINQVPSAPELPARTIFSSPEEGQEGEEEQKKKVPKKVLEKTKTVPLPPMEFKPVERTKIVKGTDFTGDGGFPKPMDLPPWTWPPEKFKDIYWFWATEVQAANPGFRPPFPGGDAAKVYSMCKKLLKQSGDDYKALELVIRVAVWDWAAIREKLEVWYTKDKEVPLIPHILKLHAQLSAKTRSGFTSASRRTSRYRAKFIDKRETKERAPGELSPAARHRAKQEEKRKAREAKKAQAG